MKTTKNIITLLLLMCFTSILAQNTTLVVDNQNPGWLSNKIPFKDQESVKNLTVTGYLNGTDIKFIRELLNNRQLAHLDLSDANIVAGGDAYYSTTNVNGTSVYNYKIDKDNSIYEYMFTGKKMNYLSLPKSIEIVNSGFYTSLDTLVIGENFKILRPSTVSENINYIYIREGVDSLEHTEYNFSCINAKKIHLPTTINYLPYSIFYGTHKNINVENIEYFENQCVRKYESGNDAGIIDNDTIIFSKKLSFWNANAFNLNDGTTIFLNDGLKRINLMWKDYRGNYHYDKGALGAKNLIIHTDSKTPVEISYYDKVSSLLNTATVYVPKGCAEIYRKKAPWSNATILEEKVPVTGITLDQENISFSDIGASVQLTATILPTDADNQKVIWKSSDTKVATVKDGKVTCTGYGTAIITATSEEGGYIATCNVTATKRIVLPSSIALDKNEATIKVGETTTLKANVLPTDADDKTIVWSSENSDIASVTNDGVVTGHKAGTTKIIVTTNANGLKDECILTVLQPTTGITLDRQNISFANIGENVQLTANVLPEDASNKNVSWASSDTKVAIVSNGNVVCTGYGTAVISAITEDGGYMATCVINATSGINGINEDKGYQDAKRYDATGREIHNPVNGLNIIKTQDGRIIKTNIQ